MKKLLIKSGRVIDPATSFDQVADLLIVDGSIAQISDTIELSDSIDIVDARGKWVTAGLIDIHTHLRDPGFEYKEDISSGAASGAAGGFTTILCMPNSNPVNDNQEVTRYIIEKGKQDASITVLPVGALTLKLQGEQLASIDDMAKGGIVALSDDGRSIQNGSLMRAAMEQSKLYNLLLMEHAESYSFNSKGDMNEGLISAKLGLVGIPKIAEDIMVARLAFLAEDLDMKAHVSHISTKRSVDIVRWAKSRGVQISAEAAPHHFTLTEDAVGEYNSMAKMSPPLREQ
ncbi:MAG: dihydroorotase, partial [Nitrospinota bacterium]